MTATRRAFAIRAVLVLLSLPLAVALIEAWAFHAANRNNGTMVSSGEHREYLLYVPTTYDQTRSTPLVISIHAAGLWPTAQMRTSRWNAEAERGGFIVAYPAGVDGNGPRIWRADGGPGLAKDVRFIADLIDTLSVHYHIDATRIYANGLSNGGGMSFVLSCALADRIAAVGMVGAAHLLPFRWCTDRRPVPMIAFHGTADPVVPYAGGTTWVARDRFPGIAGFTSQWARRNRCGATALEAKVAPDVTRFSYGDCADGADVVLYRVEDGGHTWPGGEPLPEWFTGRTSNGVDATALMWAFFRAHPRATH